MKLPVYDVAAARQNINFPNSPIDQKYQPGQHLVLDEAGLTMDDKSDLMSGIVSDQRLLQIGKDIRLGIMKSRGVDLTEANKIYLRELNGEIGERFSYAYETEPTAANLGIAWLTGQQGVLSDTVFLDFQEGAEKDLETMFGTKIAEGIDPYDFLVDNPKAQMTMAQITGDLKYLLRSKQYKALKKKIDDELKKKEAAEIPTTANISN